MGSVLDALCYKVYDTLVTDKVSQWNNLSCPNLIL